MSTPPLQYSTIWPVWGSLTTMDILFLVESKGNRCSTWYSNSPRPGTHKHIYLFYFIFHLFFFSLHFSYIFLFTYFIFNLFLLQLPSAWNKQTNLLIFTSEAGGSRTKKPLTAAVKIVHQCPQYQKQRILTNISRTH